MNHTARFPSQARPTGLGAVLASLAAAFQETAGFIFNTHAHAFYAPPAALRHPVSRRAQRFLRGGE
jgi:hypothetical protein